uniref:Uncharacterized protein n=1 Tax=Oryza meridionalis TaxID=40149 RepID=A0A0E0C668_9ORYZ
MPFFHPCSRRWLGIGLADGSSCPSGAARGGGLGSSRASDAERPTEQIVDAEALLDIAKNFSNICEVSVKNLGQSGGLESEAASLRWGDVGLSVSHVLRAAPGCCTISKAAEDCGCQYKMNREANRKYSS